MPSDSLETLHDLFVHELRDLYDAENQLVKALPLMAGAAHAPELKQAFDEHLHETKEQVRRLEQFFDGLGEKPAGKPCKAMQGLIAEARELLEKNVDPSVMDVALIVAAQKVEHYEIAGYGSVCTFCRVLGYDRAAMLFKRTMAEEERTDKLLTDIAQKLNPRAEQAGKAGDAVKQGDNPSEVTGIETSGDDGRIRGNRLRSRASGGGGARGRGQQRRSSRGGSSSRRSNGKSKSRRAASARR